MTAPVRAPSRAPSPSRPANRTAAAPRRAPAAPRVKPVARPGLHLVDDRRLRLATRRRRARAALVAGGLLVVASLFGVVVCHAMLVSGQVRLDGLQQQVAEEQTRYQALRLQVAELEAPGRVVSEAQDRLGMVSPAEITYLTPVPSGVDTPPVAPPTRSGAGAPWATVKPLLGRQG